MKKTKRDKGQNIEIGPCLVSKMKDPTLDISCIHII